MEPSNHGLFRAFCISQAHTRQWRRSAQLRLTRKNRCGKQIQRGQMHSAHFAHVFFSSAFSTAQWDRISRALPTRDSLCARTNEANAPVRQSASVMQLAAQRDVRVDLSWTMWMASPEAVSVRNG